jgi:hypothetical protein
MRRQSPGSGQNHVKMSGKTEYPITQAVTMEENKFSTLRSFPSVEPEPLRRGSVREATGFSADFALEEGC